MSLAAGLPLLCDDRCPLDQRWPHCCTGRISLLIGEAQPAYKHTRFLSCRHHVSRDAIKHDLGPPEHLKGSRLFDDTQDRYMNRPPGGPEM